MKQHNRKQRAKKSGLSFPSQEETHSFSWSSRAPAKRFAATFRGLICHPRYESFATLEEKALCNESARFGLRGRSCSRFESENRYAGTPGRGEQPAPASGACLPAAT